MGAIAIVVEVVGEGELRDVREFCGDDFCGSGIAAEQLTADFGKLEVGLTGDDVIGKADDFLLVTLVAYLGSAENDDDVRAGSFEN